MRRDHREILTIHMTRCRLRRRIAGQTNGHSQSEDWDLRCEPNRVIRLADSSRNKAVASCGVGPSWSPFKLDSCVFVRFAVSRRFHVSKWNTFRTMGTHCSAAPDLSCFGVLADPGTRPFVSTSDAAKRSRCAHPGAMYFCAALSCCLGRHLGASRFRRSLRSETKIAATTVILLVFLKWSYRVSIPPFPTL
jgi:hypothetical protein